jgi:endosialidase-like protein
MHTSAFRRAAVVTLALLATSGLMAPPVEAQLPTPSLTFVGIDPCRIADTRGNGFGGAFGPPSLAAGAARDFPVVGQCGLPAGTLVVSLNVTATNPAGAGFLILYPAGGTAPLVSTLNYLAGETVANAALVPLGPGGLTVLAGVSSADLILDVNGYFALPGDLTITGNLILPDPSTATAGSVFRGTTRFLHSAGPGPGNTFLGADAGNFTTLGLGGNTGIGFHALQSLTSGDVNTAIGGDALLSNTTGSINTAIGYGALRSNTMGFYNTATGSSALYTNQLGTYNTATGYAAFNGTGNSNVALGYNAGQNTTGNDNIHIANFGAAESNTTRIGSVQTKFYAAGIYAPVVNDRIVYVNSAGQLGTLSSSARVKEAVEDIGQTSRRLLQLRPVTFRYKPEHDDGSRRIQYGLIAEEVAEVFPELASTGPSGEVETVRYHLLSALLLNELQALHREVAAKSQALDELRRRLDALEGRLTAGH